MAASTSSAPGTDARPRRTRRPDRLTDLFLVVTAIFGAWGVGLFVLTLLAIAQPTFFYTDQKALLKAAGSTVVAVLALGQTFTMSAAMGTIPRFGLRIGLLMRSHRWGGRLAIVLAVVVAYFCMTDIGAPSTPLRGAIHGLFGSTGFAAIAIKLALIRFRPAVAYDVAPWLGRYAAVAFVIVWITSAWAYYTNTL